MVFGSGRGGPPNILVAGLCFAAISAIMMGFYAPAFVAEHGVPIIDLQGFHSSQLTLDLMARYTDAARRGYLVFLALDCFFPTCGSWLVVAVVRTALMRFGLEHSKWRYGLVFPIAAAIADLCENFFHAYLTLSYPAHAHTLAQLAWLFTCVKFLFLVGNYGVFSIALVALVAKQVARLRQSGS